MCKYKRLESKTSLGYSLQSLNRDVLSWLCVKCVIKFGTLLANHVSLSRIIIRYLHVQQEYFLSVLIHWFKLQISISRFISTLHLGVVSFEALKLNPLFSIDVFKQQRVNFNRGQRENQSSTGELVFFSLSLYFAVRTFCTFPVGHACLNVDPLTWLNVSGAVGLHISTVLPAAWGLPVGVASWQLLELISDLLFFNRHGPKISSYTFMIILPGLV